MSSFRRQVARNKARNLPVNLALRVTTLENYIKHLDKFLAVLDKHFPDVMKEAFPSETDVAAPPTEAPSVVPPAVEATEEKKAE